MTPLSYITGIVVVVIGTWCLVWIWKYLIRIQQQHQKQQQNVNLLHYYNFGKVRCCTMQIVPIITEKKEKHKHFLVLVGNATKCTKRKKWRKNQYKVTFLKISRFIDTHTVRVYGVYCTLCRNTIMYKKTQFWNIILHTSEWIA